MKETTSTTARESVKQMGGELNSLTVLVWTFKIRAHQRIDNEVLVCTNAYYIQPLLFSVLNSLLLTGDNPLILIPKI